MPPPFTIRLATLADLTDLRLLWDALYQEKPGIYPTMGSEDRIHWTQDVAMRLELQQTGQTKYYLSVATTTGVARAIGCLIGQLVHRDVGHPNDFWIIDHLYVIPAFRNQYAGVGPALIAHALTHARTVTPTCDMLELVSMYGDPLWARHGWEPNLIRYHSTVDQVARRLPLRLRNQIPSPPLARKDLH